MALGASRERAGALALGSGLLLLLAARLHYVLGGWRSEPEASERAWFDLGLWWEHLRSPAGASLHLLAVLAFGAALLAARGSSRPEVR